MATISNTSRPGYVWDTTDNVWYPIGTGVHTHDYVASTLIDAKGDLIVGSAADTAARLAVGTNDHVLTADSSATNGVKWAALPASSPTFVGCRLTKSAVQSLDNATGTAITWDTETFDTDGFHSTVSNTSRITIPTGKGGKYLITGLAGYDENGSGARSTDIRKNGTTIYIASNPATPSNIETQNSFATIQSLSAGDYIEMFAYQSSGGNLNFPKNNQVPQRVEFSVQYLGA